jgi:hypothetical protein
VDQADQMFLTFCRIIGRLQASPKHETDWRDLRCDGLIRINVSVARLFKMRTQDWKIRLRTSMQLFRSRLTWRKH